MKSQPFNETLGYRRVPEMLIDAMAERWYGYGRWDAPYWFLGIQPGGGHVNAVVAAWNKLGRGELLDCKEHHLAFGYTRWHTPPYALQPTWRRLMLLLLSFQGEDTSPDALKAYQAIGWGAAAGETCAIELSSIAARRFCVAIDDPHIPSRIVQIRKRLSEYGPKFIVMYSDEKRYFLPLWEKLTRCSFDSQRMCRTGDTIAMVTPHPVAFGKRDADWMRFGRMLRERCEAEAILDTTEQCKAKCIT